MPILYIAFTLFCAVSPINDWEGDIDSGTNCVTIKAEFPTLNQCAFRLFEDEKLL